MLNINRRFPADGGKLIPQGGRSLPFGLKNFCIPSEGKLTKMSIKPQLMQDTSAYSAKDFLLFFSYFSTSLFKKKKKKVKMKLSENMKGICSVESTQLSAESSLPLRCVQLYIKYSKLHSK